MRELLLMCCEGKQREDYVFTRDLPNRPIGDFRKLWRNLLKAAGIERKILFHDFRRSSVTNMIERGVDRDVAMQISGTKHQTCSAATTLSARSRLRMLRC